MKFKHLFILSALCAITQGVWAQWLGAGTEDSPYQINNVADLKRLASDVNEGEPYSGIYFAVTQDITSVGAFTPIGTGNRFNGIFDGRGFTISDIYINTDSYSGLFGAIGFNGNTVTAVVKNVKLASHVINSSGHYCGGVVGYNDNGIIENCQVLSGTIMGGTDCGGIVGGNNYGTVKNCHVASGVDIRHYNSTNLDLGGIAGYNSGTVSGCTNASSFNNSGHHIVGGIVGWNANYGDSNNGIVENCLYLGASFKSAVNQSGVIVGYNAGTTSNSYYINNTFKGVGVDDYNLGKDVEGAQLAVVSNSIPEDIGTEGTTYDNNGITVYSNGLKYNNKYYTPYVADGTTANPYIIASPYDLNQLAASVNGGTTYEGKNIILVNNLVYGNGTGDPNYTPVGNNVNVFKGIFNGQFHTIKGIVVYTSDYYNGVFGYLDGGGVVKNLTLATSNITGGWNTAGIVGENRGTVENCHVAEDVILQLYHESTLNQILGGVVGWNMGTIAGCTNGADLDIVGNREIGGIAGYSYGIVKDCLYLGNITVSDCQGDVGAIVGCNNGGTLTNNYYTQVALRGVGNENQILGEDVEGALHALEYSELNDVPDGIGDPVLAYGEGSNIGIIAREHGLYYYSTEKYYYPGQLEIVLYDDQDNTDVIESYIGRTVNVQLQGRTFYKDGTWNTLTLPFFVKIPAPDVTDGTEEFEGAEFMQITTAEFNDGTLTLQFNSLVNIPAGEPFLVRWPVDENTSGSVVSNPSFENVKVGRYLNGPNAHYTSPTPYTFYAASTYPTNENNEDNLLTMKGSYAPVTLSANDRTKLYLSANNTLFYPDAEVTLGAFRCYFELLGGLTAGDLPNEVNAFNLNFGDNDASAIKDVQSMVNGQWSMVNGQWYTLDGRRLNGMPTQRGIYINNGRKVVIK